MTTKPTRTTRSRSLIQCAAYHAAGHAVARHHLKYAGKNLHLSLVSGREAGSAGHASPYPRLSLAVDLHRALDMIQVCLAGGVAEKRFGGRGNRRAIESDTAQAAELARRVSIEPETDALLRWLELRTERLVEFYWPEVQLVARALLQRKTLTGEEVTELIDSRATAA